MSKERSDLESGVLQITYVGDSQGEHYSVSALWYNSYFPEIVKRGDRMVGNIR